MNKLIILAIVVLTLISCQDEVVYKEDHFKRIIGFEGSSSVRKIVELDNGDLLIVGKIGVSAHGLVSTNVGVEIEKVENQGPFIAFTDENGYVKKLKTFPIEEYESHPLIEILDPTNKITFTEIMENPKGGYHVLAELGDFDFTFTDPNTGNQTTVYSTPQTRNSTPFLMELDADFNLKTIISFNGSPDWDFTTRNNPTMKKLSDDEFIILFRWKNNFPSSRFVGYSLMHLNHDLQTLGLYENWDSDKSKFACDFDVIGDELVVFGSDTGAFYTYRHSIADNFNLVDSKFIDNDGQAGDNTNVHFIKKLQNDNQIIIYTSGFNSIKGRIYDPNWKLVSLFEFANENTAIDAVRAPRAMYEMDNGDILLYSIYIPENDDPVRGEVIRNGQAGNQIFKLDIEGSPGDIVQLQDGNILFGSNAVHNQLLQRITLYKIDQNGQQY